MQALERLPKTSMADENCHEQSSHFPVIMERTGVLTALKTDSKPAEKVIEVEMAVMLSTTLFLKRLKAILASLSASIGWMHVSQQESLETSTCLARYLFETKMRRQVTLPVVVSSSRTSRNNCLFFRENIDGSNQNSLERLLIDRKMKGPSWLKLVNQSFQS
jgi:hypothetical protein